MWEKNNGTTKYDKSTVKFDVGTTQCNDETIKYEKTNYGKLWYHWMWQKYGHMWNYFSKFLGFGGITVIFLGSKHI